MEFDAWHAGYIAGIIDSSVAVCLAFFLQGFVSGIRRERNRG